MVDSDSSSYVNVLRYLDLFHQAILMSGTHLARWAINTGPYKYSKMLAKELECDLPSSPQMMDCLRTKIPDELSSAMKNVVSREFHPLLY